MENTRLPYAEHFVNDVQGNNRYLFSESFEIRKPKCIIPWTKYMLSVVKEVLQVVNLKGLVCVIKTRHQKIDM
jgi:hypothetical protein